LFVSLAAGAVQAQAPAATRAQSIRGQVTNAQDSAPLRRARVVVSEGDRQIELVFTDDQGQFAIANAPVTALTIRATKAGYTAARVSVPGGRAGTEIRIALTRSAGVTGRVRDENGSPVSLAYVTGRLLLPGSDRRSDASNRFFAQTDRLGDYRLGSLPAGRYEITAVRIPPELRPAKVEEQLFGPPDILDVATGAVTMTLAGGDAVADVDFTIPGIAQTCLTGPGVRPPDGVVAGGISGRVTGSSGEPRVCATVQVGPDAPVSQVYTDRQGRYEIDGLPAGSFFLEARHAGYLPLYHGQRQPADAETLITLREGERRTGADIVLPRESFITGTVVDEHGEPMEGIPVFASQLRQMDGRLGTTMPIVPRPTDDRGQYRVVGLAPGTYLIATLSTRGAVGAAAGSARAYSSIFHPGTPDAAMAQRIAIAAGRDAHGIDILYTPTVTATVSGSAVDAAGRPLAGTASLSVSGRSGAVSVDSWSVRLGADGAFAFLNVPRGDYVAKVARPGGAHFGMQYVTVVDGDPPPVRVTASVAATLEGRIVIEGPPDLNIAGLTVSIAPADFDHTPPQWGGPRAMFGREDDGTFRAAGAAGPSRIVTGATPACEGCYLKSAYVNGTDAADRPFDFGLKGGVFRDVEIVVSDAGAAIEGRATDDRGAAIRVYSVVILPTDQGLWYSGSRHMKTMRSERDGAYRVTGLPPGDYFVAAVTGLQFPNPDLIEPELLDQIAARGLRVTVGERERRTLDLRLIRR